MRPKPGSKDVRALATASVAAASGDCRMKSSASVEDRRSSVGSGEKSTRTTSAS
jgi:hypothetical protein